MVHQEVWLEPSRLDWKIFLSEAFRCALVCVCKEKKKKSGGKPMSRPDFLGILHLHEIELFIVPLQV